jgi:hypothetical protein
LRGRVCIVSCESITFTNSHFARLAATRIAA